MQICQSLWFYHALWYHMSLKSSSYWQVNINFFLKHNPQEFVTTKKHIKYSLCIILTARLLNLSPVTQNVAYSVSVWPQNCSCLSAPADGKLGQRVLSGAFKVGLHMQLIPPCHVGFGSLTSLVFAQAEPLLFGILVQLFSLVLESAAGSFKLPEGKCHTCRLYCRTEQAGPDPSVPAPGEKSPEPSQFASSAPAKRKVESFRSFPALGLHEDQPEPQLEKSRMQEDGGGRPPPPLPSSFEPRTWLRSVVLEGCARHFGSLRSVESATFSSFVAGGHLLVFLDCCCPRCQ